MPKKIRELKTLLSKAGCISEPGKGSHIKWKHPLINRKIILSGKDGADAKRYQEKEVMQLLKDIKKAEL